MKLFVWRKEQVLAVLCGTVLLMGVAAAALGRWLQPRDEEAVAAFAQDDFVAEVPEVSPAPVVDTAFHVEVIHTTKAPAEEAKRILIYHTHTWEAFEQVSEAPYKETEKWRSKDNQANMVAVGNALAASLEALGFIVVHDETAFEPPDLSSSYKRSLVMLEERTARGETYDLYIDLHRDAIASSSTIKRTVSISGVDVARFMVLVGKGEDYAAKPDWQKNYAIAQTLTDALNAQAENLCRDIKVKTGRFNQHIAPCCVLIECGNNYNTLEQVMAGVPYLAEAIRKTLAKQ